MRDVNNNKCTYAENKYILNKYENIRDVNNNKCTYAENKCLLNKYGNIRDVNNNKWTYAENKCLLNKYDNIRDVNNNEDAVQQLSNDPMRDPVRRAITNAIKCQLHRFGSCDT